MINESTQKAIKEQKSKLMLAESTDEIKDIVTKAGGEISAEDAEQLWNEIKHVKESLGQEIDDDEMDAVAGGADREWLKEGCAATVEPGSWCGSNDYCSLLDVTYDIIPWDYCPQCDGMLYFRGRGLGYKCNSCKRIFVQNSADEWVLSSKFN